MDPELVTSIFSFGLKVAEHVHGINRAGDDKSNDRILETVRTVAAGELTLIGTPEEVFASLPTPPEWLRVKAEKEFYDMMLVSRENERITAQLVDQSLPK